VGGVLRTGHGCTNIHVRLWVLEFGDLERFVFFGIWGICHLELGEEFGIFGSLEFAGKIIYLSFLHLIATGRNRSPQEAGLLLSSRTSFHSDRELKYQRWKK
jgi:hypothetical protein